MVKSQKPGGFQNKILRQNHRRRSLSLNTHTGDRVLVEINVGRHLRELHAENNLSLRALAEQNGLNVNTLSLIKNSKTSPSVSTLQQLALTIAILITTFFKTALPKMNVVYQKFEQHPQVPFSHGALEDLGAGITGHGAEPFFVELEPGADSGLPPIVHSGREFVY